jgi:hypothetical protein
VPAHCVNDAGAKVTFGNGLTVIGTMAEVVHPLLVVPTTVYVVEVVGDAVIIASVCEEMPAAGVQKYVDALTAVIVVLPPKHIALSEALASVAGLTVTGKVALAVQP